MSFCAGENAGYFETIQLYFTELTRRSMFLSGRDLELLDDWRERGATATAVCRGLRDAVESMPADDPPRDVWACRDYVEPYVERAAERAVGGRDHRASDAPSGNNGESSGRSPSDRGDVEPGGETGESAPSDDLVERALDRIERAGRSVEDEQVRNVYRRAWREVRELLGAEDVGERLAGLASVEETLVDGFYRALNPGDRERIESEIAPGESTLLEGMSPEARRQHLRAQRRRVLVEEYDLISLIDYSDERSHHE